MFRAGLGFGLMPRVHHGGMPFGGGFRGPFFGGGFHLGGHNLKPFAIAGGIVGSLAVLFGGRNRTNINMQGGYMPGMQGGYYPSSMNNGYYPGLNLSNSEDPLKGLRGLYPDYNFEMIEGKYCARLKDGSGDTITANSASELMSKLGASKPTVSKRANAEATEVAEIRNASQAETPADDDTQTYVQKTNSTPSNSRSNHDSTHVDTEESTTTVNDSKKTASSTSKKWEVKSSPGILSDDAYLKAADGKTYLIHTYDDCDLNYSKLDKNALEQNQIRTTNQKIDAIRLKDSNVRYPAWRTKDGRIMVKYIDGNGKTVDVALETFLNSQKHSNPIDCTDLTKNRYRRTNLINNILQAKHYKNVKVSMNATASQYYVISYTTADGKTVNKEVHVDDTGDLKYLFQNL